MSHLHFLFGDGHHDIGAGDHQVDIGSMHGLDQGDGQFDISGAHQDASYLNWGSHDGLHHTGADLHHIGTDPGDAHGLPVEGHDVSIDGHNDVPWLNFGSHGADPGSAVDNAAHAASMASNLPPGALSSGTPWQHITPEAMQHDTDGDGIPDALDNHVGPVA